MTSLRWLAACLLPIACGHGSTMPATDAPATVVIQAPQAPQSAAADPLNSVQPVSRHANKAELQQCVAAMRSNVTGLKSTDVEAEKTYREAIEAERDAQLQTARKKLFEVIQRYPTSGLIPLAYLGFGEMFARDAEQDSNKYELAQQAFREVVKVPPPDNVTFAYAWLRSGQISMATKAPERALAAFKSAAEAARTWPQQPCAAQVGAAALEGLADAYAAAGQPERAWTFLRTVVGPANVDAQCSVLTELASKYLRVHQADDAAKVLTSALAERSASLCECLRPVIEQVMLKATPVARRSLESARNGTCGGAP